MCVGVYRSDVIYLEPITSSSRLPAPLSPTHAYCQGALTFGRVQGDSIVVVNHSIVWRSTHINFVASWGRKVHTYGHTKHLPKPNPSQATVLLYCKWVWCVGGEWAQGCALNSVFKSTVCVLWDFKSLRLPYSGIYTSATAIFKASSGAHAWGQCFWNIDTVNPKHHLPVSITYS